MLKRNWNKIISFIITVIIILAAYFTASIVFQWFPYNTKKIDIYPSPPKNLSQDNYIFIKNIAENLSNIIFEPNCSKGREFGTEGEHYAAFNIIKPEMEKLNLYNPNLTPIYIEQITNVPYPYKILSYINLNLTDKLEVISKSLTVHNMEDNNSFNVECFICPTWNNTNPFDNRNVLTNNFSYQGIKVRMHNEINFDDFLNYAYNEVIHWKLNESESLENLTTKLLENYYNFTLEGIDPDNSSTWPSFVIPINIKTDEKFVLLEVNKGFNPNYNDPDENNRSLHPIWAMFKKWFEKWIDIIFNSCNYENIVGKIQYDFDPNCHDTRPNIGTSIPIILINGTDGKKIKNIINTCTIDFHINQRFNTSVISYNVIGQINGTDPDINKTIIVCSLYDSMWCQGTVDSAIGVGIVLTMAKYFKELEQSGTSPKYNMRFITFGGEEYNMLGAKYYEYAHRNETIPLVIDINQVGYNQKNPPQIMHVITNKAKEMNGIKEIIEKSNYENKTTDGSLIDIDLCPIGSRSNDLAFASSPYRIGKTQTVLFLKDFGWTLHHRDGRENGTGPLHTDGDTMKLYNETEVALTADMVLNVTYGLIFKEEINEWNWIGFIPFFIVIILVILVTILIFKKINIY